MDSVTNLKRLLEEADNRLLALLGADAYAEAYALLRELEDLIDPLGQEGWAEALATLNTLIVLRKRRNG